MRCYGLILAGGASSRMGRPKALLSIDGETFLDRLVSVFRKSCEDVIVVLGYGAEPIRTGIRSQPTIVVNPHPERGQLSSMQCGLRMLPADADAFLFTPVDCPAIESSTLERLIAAAEANPHCVMAIPAFEGKRGHPVLCRASLTMDFLALDERGQAREVVHRNLNDAVLVDVNDPGTVTDVDDAQAYERLLAARL